MLSLHAPRCAVCSLRASGVFCSLLQGAALQQLDRDKTAHVYRRGQGLFYTGGPPLAIHCIRSGRVKLHRVGSNGEEHVLRLLGPGDTLGYQALLAGEPHAATAEAMEETAVCTISRETLLGLLRQSPELTFELLAKIARELSASEERVLEVAHRPVRKRVASLLLLLAEAGGPTRSKGLSPGVKRKDMAGMIGTTPETLSRTLHHFARRGLLAVTRSEIQIRDLAALRRIAGEPAAAAS